MASSFKQKYVNVSGLVVTVLLIEPQVYIYLLVISDVIATYVTTNPTVIFSAHITHRPAGGRVLAVSEAHWFLDVII